MWKQLLLHIGFVASAGTIFLWSEKYYQQANPDGQLGLIVLGFFCLFFLLFSLLQEYRFSRKARYTEALQYLHVIYGECIRVKAENINTQNELLYILKDTCNNLSSVFSLITGTSCSVCIKVLEHNGDTQTPNRMSVGDLCRNSTSERRSKNGTSKTIHWLDKNTDFIELFQTIDRPESGIIIYNNIPAIRSYQNTSFEDYGFPSGHDIPLLGWLLWRFNWTLPYKSAIVGAIFPLSPVDSDRIVGFLCVDSKSRRVFKRRYDMRIVRNVSSAIYPIVDRWATLVNTAGGSNA